MGSLHSYEAHAEPVGDVPPISVQGRLREHSAFWLEELEASDFVRGIVTEGYRLPFFATPEPMCHRNHSSALSNDAFVSTAIAELLQTQCVAEVECCPKVCSPLQVATNARGKMRLVVDLRYINSFLWKDKFKYEDIKLVPQMFSRGDFFTTFDLKSGYHRVDIHKEFWDYLGFSWGTGAHRKFYVFRVLPFGLAIACYVFTKLLRPLVKRWRARGLRCIVYIDDGICASPNFELASWARDLIVSDLGRAGFVLNLEKSQLDPSQFGRWLGFEIDLYAGSFRVPSDKISKLKNLIASIDPCSQVQVRLIASVAGQIISMGLALGPVARLRTRALYTVIEQRQYWNDRLFLTDEAREELQFWQEHVDQLNEQPIWFSSGATRVVFTDASSSGFGGFIVGVGSSIAHGQWSAYEIQQSSTWRELKAVDQVLRSFASVLAGHTIKWFTDNQNVVRIVRVGSRRPHLQDGAMSIFEVCLQYGVKLEMEWIPRTLNEKADYISRIIDHDDWQINPVIFHRLDCLWGPHTYDRFASPHNSQLPRFDSKFWNPLCSAVDTFTTSWSGDVNWWVPPPYLVCRTVRHAESCSARGTLILPAWRSAPFWPLICPDGTHLALFIQAWTMISFVPQLVIPGLAGHSIGDSLHEKSYFLAVHIDFSVAPRSILVDPNFCTSIEEPCSGCS